MAKPRKLAERSAKATAPPEVCLDDAEHTMMAAERRTQIVQIVRSKGRVKVNDLKQRFRTSAVTIRKDLNDLHEKGLLMRSHGGAVRTDTVLRESPG